MKRKTINIQINYESILLYDNEKYIEYNFRWSIKNYKIINKTLFIEKFQEILDERKINAKLLTDNINIIIEQIYNQEDIEKLKDIFKELSFNDINIITNINILNKRSKEIIINVNEKNIKIYYQNKVIDTNIHFAKHLEILYLYLKEILSEYKVNNIKLYGQYEKINQLARKLEKKLQQEIYIYCYPQLLPIHLFMQ